MLRSQGANSVNPPHLVAGLLMMSLGAGGLVYCWTALGVVARGLVPFGLIGSGLVMAAAGAKAMREKRGVPHSLQTATPLLVTTACLVLAAAAAAGVDVDLPDALTPGRIVGYMALGLVSGIVGGMLGLGGGVVHLSGMTLLFGFPFGFARGATLINNVFINAAAAIRYGRRGFMLWSAVAVLLPAALIGVTAGSLLQEGFDEDLMRKIFAVFIIVVGCGIAVDTLDFYGKGERSQQHDESPARFALTGGLAGFLSGVLGISGGIVAVPGQTMLSGVPLRRAIANSTVVTSVSSGLGSLMLLLFGGGSAFGSTEMTTIALLFIPGNLLGGHFGALWMERLPLVAVRGFFVTALLAIALRSWGLVL